MIFHLDEYWNMYVASFENLKESWETFWSYWYSSFQIEFEWYSYVSSYKYCFDILRRCQGGWLGGFSPAPLQFLADYLTLFQPGGQIMPTTLLPVQPPTPSQIFGQCGVSVLNFINENKIQVMKVPKFPVEYAMKLHKWNNYIDSRLFCSSFERCLTSPCKHHHKHK